MMSNVCNTCNVTHAPYMICDLPRCVCTRVERHSNCDEPFRTGNGLGGASLKHGEHPIHIMRTVRVMYNDCAATCDVGTYVYTHAHSSRGRMGVRMEKEALLRHPWPEEGVTTQYGHDGMCVETPPRECHDDHRTRKKRRCGITPVPSRGD